MTKSYLLSFTLFGLFSFAIHIAGISYFFEQKTTDLEGGGYVVPRCRSVKMCAPGAYSHRGETKHNKMRDAELSALDALMRTQGNKTLQPSLRLSKTLQDSPRLSKTL